MLFQGSGQLEAVAHGDVADQAALADHHPGDLVQRIRAGPGRRVPGPVFQAAEGTGVEGGPGLGEHHRHALAQQPPVAGPDDLPGHEQDEPREQLVAVMTPDRDASLQRQFSPAEAGGVGPACQPALLPGVSGLPLEPVQQLGQPSPPGLVPGQARARIGEQAQQPPRQVFPALPRLPPVLLTGSRLPHGRPARRWRSGDLGGIGGAVADRRFHLCSPPGAEVPNSAASTSGR